MESGKITSQLSQCHNSYFSLFLQSKFYNYIYNYKHFYGYFWGKMNSCDTVTTVTLRCLASSAERFDRKDLNVCFEIKLGSISLADKKNFPYLCNVIITHPHPPFQEGKHSNRESNKPI